MSVRASFAEFDKGSAQVQLAPDGDGTKLSYQVKASVGGKLAQIGSRLVVAAARKIATDFCAAFNEKVAALHGAPAEVHEEHLPEPVPRDPDLPTVSDASLAFLAAGSLVVCAVALIVLFGYVKPLSCARVRPSAMARRPSRPGPPWPAGRNYFLHGRGRPA